MDSFASLALSTEDPNKSNGFKEQVLSRFPYKRTDPLLSKIMVRNMFGHAFLQLAILLFIIFGMGDVCAPGANPNVCTGRPIEFDKGLIKDYDTWNCVPPCDKDKKE